MGREWGRQGPGRAPLLTLLTAAALLAGCSSSSASYAQVEGAGGSVNAPRGTVAIGVTIGEEDCDRNERECAELFAIEALLFTGVPGTSLPRPMVNNERQARAQYEEYFKDLLEDGEHRRYVVRVEEESDAYTVIVNHDALRRSLEQEGIIRRFGR